MLRRGVLLAVTGVVLVWVGVAFAAGTASPPPGAWSGHYKVTIKVTNTRSTPSHWIYGVKPRCSSPCHAFSYRLRLVSEKSWRDIVLTARWNGKGYAYAKMHPKSADCVAKSGATVKKGYDVLSSQKFHPRTVTKGRVTRWSGTGKDSYVPNAKGRAHHCTSGAYIYAYTGVAQ